MGHNMSFNSTKFQLLRYGPNADLKISSSYFTEDMEDIIMESEVVRDLGVLVSSSANFQDHIEKVIKKVKQKSGWVLRSFKSRDPMILKHLWQSVIRPHQDYSSQLWWPANGELK